MRLYDVVEESISSYNEKQLSNHFDQHSLLPADKGYIIAHEVEIYMALTPQNM